MNPFASQLRNYSSYSSRYNTQTDRKNPGFFFFMTPITVLLLMTGDTIIVSVVGIQAYTTTDIDILR